MKNRLSRLFGTPFHSSPQEEAAALTRLFGVCPGCHADMAGHYYFRLASVLLDDLDKNEKLADLITRAQWQQVLEFQDWRADGNEREYYAIRCPNQKELLLFKVVSVSDMSLDDFVESRQSLDPPSSLSLAQAVGNKWQKL